MSFLFINFNKTSNSRGFHLRQSRLIPYLILWTGSLDPLDCNRGPGNGVLDIPDIQYPPLVYCVSTEQRERERRAPHALCLFCLFSLSLSLFEIYIASPGRDRFSTIHICVFRRV